MYLLVVSDYQLIFFLTAVIMFAPLSLGHSQDVGNPQWPGIPIHFLYFQESVVWCPPGEYSLILVTTVSLPGLPWCQTVKNLPVMEETKVQSLGQEDPLEKGMATHSSILAWRIPWTEEPGGVQFMGWQRVRHDRATFFLSWVCHGKK